MLSILTLAGDFMIFAIPSGPIAHCSSVPERISERIMEHSDKSGNLYGHLSVSKRYGEISEEELIHAID